MRISKSTAFISAAFIAFLFFCIGRYCSASPVTQNITVETERPAAVETAAETPDVIPDAALPVRTPEAPADTDDAPSRTTQTHTSTTEGTDPETSGSPAEPPAAGLININTATAAQLDSLPGIGEVLSQRIIEYRQANGPFAAPWAHLW